MIASDIVKSFSSIHSMPFVDQSYHYPIYTDNRKWRVLATGRVVPGKVLSHLIEVLPEGVINKHKKQVLVDLPFAQVFTTPNLSLIERISGYFEPAYSERPGIEVDWDILKAEGFNTNQVQEAIEEGIALRIFSFRYIDGIPTLSLY